MSLSLVKKCMSYDSLSEGKKKRLGDRSMSICDPLRDSVSDSAKFIVIPALTKGYAGLAIKSRKIHGASGSLGHRRLHLRSNLAGVADFAL